MFFIYHVPILALFSCHYSRSSSHGQLSASWNEHLKSLIGLSKFMLNRDCVQFFMSFRCQFRFCKTQIIKIKSFECYEIETFNGLEWLLNETEWLQSQVLLYCFSLAVNIWPIVNETYETRLCVLKAIVILSNQMKKWTKLGTKRFWVHSLRFFFIL